MKKNQLYNEGNGFFYWGGEWIFTDPEDNRQGSPWENQTLFDLNHSALPALDAFVN
ncbi:glycosyl hydrolase 53 family protein [Treponema sp.]|uniref:glycosyl hydrolase 53 family protein n=1 Tax=Treponema sp. TaxID=166 RepID=UPI0039A389D2